MFGSILLPQHDKHADKREAQLAEARETYSYAYAWPPGVAVAAEVPKGDSYSLPYIAEIMLINAKLFANSVESAGFIADAGALKDFLDAELKEAAGLSPKALGKWFFDVHSELATYLSDKRPQSVDDYGELFASIDEVPCLPVWDDDRTFAWQRIAGVNPMVMQRIDAVPENIGIGETEYTHAIGDGDTLATAAAQGRLFACDYTFLDGAPGGVTLGHQKYVHGPYGLFAAVDGVLKTVAIQIGKALGSPVYGPGDTYDWRLAKLAMNVADAAHHETTSHLGRTHMVMEAVAVTLRRQLAKHHPLHVLLAEHTDHTMPINQSAATSLIAPGGAIDQMFGPTIETTASLVRLAIDSFPINAASPPDELAARGVDDTDVIADAPYRDDAMLVWPVIERFVAGYVGHYYKSDEDVVADGELAAFVAELGAQDGGRLAGVDAPTTVAALSKLIATLVWIGSAQHAAVNFPQFPYMSVMPNMVGAFWSDWPATAPADAAKHLAVMAPINMASLQFNTVYQLSSLRYNHLGKYGLTTFLSLEVRALVSTFQEELEAAEAVIVERDKGRYLPYPHLLPSLIPASIHI